MPSALPPPLAIAQMASGYWISQALYVAARLGVADLLVSGPRAAAELAAECGVQPAALNRRNNLNAIRRVGHKHGCMPHTC